jgi:hypothetical protein
MIILSKKNSLKINLINIKPLKHNTNNSFDKKIKSNNNFNNNENLQKNK